MGLDFDHYLGHFLKSRDCIKEPTEGDLDLEEKKPGLKRALNVFDLTMFGFSAIIGGGIFVVTGLQAKNNSGPAVMIGYLIAGIVALLTALCYAELSSEVTTTGGAFTYATKLYGRGVGWAIAANVTLEYLLAGATVAKGFADYLTTLCNQEANAWKFCVSNCDDPANALVLDPVAAAALVFLTIVMIFGVKESFVFNTVTVIASVVAIMVTIIAGATAVDPANYTEPNGFMPYGFKGVFKSASSVFFAYVGFDMIANGAEEARNPKRDIPLSTMLALGICTSLYCAASTVIAGMQPYYEISDTAPFAVALQNAGMAWGATIVSIGAVAGTLNSAFADLYAMSRLVIILGRTELAPRWLCHINPKLKTPVTALLAVGTVMTVLSLIVPLSVLADIVSMGTLVAFSVVDISVAVRARWVAGDGRGKGLYLVIYTAMVAIGSLGAAFFYYYSSDSQPFIIPMSVFGGVWALGTLGFYFVPSIYTPKGYICPLNPLLPCLGCGACLFLVGTLGPTTWIYWCYAMAGSLLVGLLITWTKYFTYWPRYKEQRDAQYTEMGYEKDFKEGKAIEG